MIEEKIAKPAMTTGVEQVMRQLVSAARADAVFGQPIERGETTVIPCSELAIGLGMGSGAGPVDAQGNQTGGGAGGGGGARSRPIAAIILSRDGVRVEPILDMTKVVLASFTTGAFILFWLARLIRGSRPGKEPSFGQLKRAIEL